MNEEHNDKTTHEKEAFEFTLQKERVRKIFGNVIYKLKILSALPQLLENNGQILTKFLNKTEVDFILFVCQECTPFSRQAIESRSDLTLICNMLEKINLNEKKVYNLKKPRSFGNADQFDIHVAYAIDIILRSKPLVAYIESMNISSKDELMVSFIDAMAKLEHVASEQLSISAKEEIKRERDMKMAYRQSVMLSQSIEELEDLLNKQREELTKEHDRKEAILEDLTEKLDQLKEKCTKEINKMVYDSEVVMMKDYLKSAERQEELSKLAKESTHEYNALLEEHLTIEKSLRAKRLKVETQLASWVAKYDVDIGEKQSEYDALKETYRQIQDELREIQDKLDEQEDEYFELMKEKEEEEERIRNEKAWIFLQNRSARRIQRAYRAYKARKLARKKGRKSKKKGDKEGSAGGKKGKKSGKDTVETPTAYSSTADPNETLSKKFTEAVLGEIKSKEAFSKHDLEVDLVD